MSVANVVLAAITLLVGLPTLLAVLRRPRTGAAILWCIGASFVTLVLAVVTAARVVSGGATSPADHAMRALAVLLVPGSMALAWRALVRAAWR